MRPRFLALRPSKGAQERIFYTRKPSELWEFRKDATNQRQDTRAVR